MLARKVSPIRETSILYSAYAIKIDASLKPDSSIVFVTSST